MLSSVSGAGSRGDAGVRGLVLAATHELRTGDAGMISAAPPGGNVEADMDVIVVSAALVVDEGSIALLMDGGADEEASCAVTLWLPALVLGKGAWLFPLMLPMPSVCLIVSPDADKCADSTSSASLGADIW